MLADNVDILRALLFFQFAQQEHFSNQSLDQSEDNYKLSFMEY